MLGASEFLGGFDSFVFKIKPKMQGYLATGDNDYFMLCQPGMLNIGSQGEGPALQLDETFKTCYTYKSATFKNELLTGRTEGRFLNRFEVRELELFII